MVLFIKHIFITLGRLLHPSGRHTTYADTSISSSGSVPSSPTNTDPINRESIRTLITTSELISPLQTVPSLDHHSHNTINDSAGVQLISSPNPTLLVTCSGNIYMWGSNLYGRILRNGPYQLSIPTKLPLENIVSASAGTHHSLALSRDGAVFGWGLNKSNQLNMSTEAELTITKLDISLDIVSLLAGFHCSFVLTRSGQVYYWGNRQGLTLIEELNNIVFINNHEDKIACIDSDSNIAIVQIDYDFRNYELLPLTQTNQTNRNSIINVKSKYCCLSNSYLLVIDLEENIWLFKTDFKSWRVIETIKGIAKPKTVAAGDGYFACLTSEGKVFVWGKLSRLGSLDDNQSAVVKGLANIEGISIGKGCFFAYNKHFVWVIGRNHLGKLGTGDFKDLPMFRNVFGSEITGVWSFKNTISPFLFKTLYNEVMVKYINYLEGMFGGNVYVKARFLSKMAFSRKTVSIAKLLVKSRLSVTLVPTDIDLIPDSFKLRLILNKKCSFSKDNVKENVETLCLKTNSLNRDDNILSIFPGLKELCISSLANSEHCSFNSSSIFLNLKNLQILEIDYPISNLPLLPTSLVKLVLKSGIEISGLRHCEGLKYLEVSDYRLSSLIIKGCVPLPQTLHSLTLCLSSDQECVVHLPNLKELFLMEGMLRKFSDGFPMLNFLSIGDPSASIFGSEICPHWLRNNNSIKEAYSLKNGFLVKLSSSPYYIQFPINNKLRKFFKLSLNCRK
ncbi:hypothetical protein P9112_001833 [Eukaryota sp. TZLM1-RC]